ncbi:hypothetical protein DdX_04666 [Ditylenchus destructor]|uniref:Uncharacterized protein n=1 Tax=Ditylenchus destructor TaxID=166010 RepID=A0AAD4NA10_9BILA|nr:hypothetical protein DdX_04666 [Ditylenchus destructor]
MYCFAIITLLVFSLSATNGNLYPSRYISTNDANPMAQFISWHANLRKRSISQENSLDSSHIDPSEADVNEGDGYDEYIEEIDKKRESRGGRKEQSDQMKNSLEVSIDSDEMKDKTKQKETSEMKDSLDVSLGSHDKIGEESNEEAKERKDSLDVSVGSREKNSNDDDFGSLAEMEDVEENKKRKKRQIEDDDDDDIMGTDEGDEMNYDGQGTEADEEDEGDNTNDLVNPEGVIANDYDSIDSANGDESPPEVDNPIQNDDPLDDRIEDPEEQTGFNKETDNELGDSLENDVGQARPYDDVRETEGVWSQDGDNPLPSTSDTSQLGGKLPEFLRVSSQNARDAFLQLEQNPRWSKQRIFQEKVDWAANQPQHVQSLYLKFVSDQNRNKLDFERRRQALLRGMSPTIRRIDKQVQRALNNPHLTRVQSLRAVNRIFAGVPSSILRQMQRLMPVLGPLSDNYVPLGSHERREMRTLPVQRNDESDSFADEDDSGDVSRPSEESLVTDSLGYPVDTDEFESDTYDQSFI